MPNRGYVNGANFERRVKARLEREGWTVFRCAGSHSPADLVAVRKAYTYDDGLGAPLLPEVRLVQCKGGNATMTRAERASFDEYASELGCEAWVALRGMKFERAGEVAA